MIRGTCWWGAFEWVAEATLGSQTHTCQTLPKILQRHIPNQSTNQTTKDICKNSNIQ